MKHTFIYLLILLFTAQMCASDGLKHFPVISLEKIYRNHNTCFTPMEMIISQHGVKNDNAQSQQRSSIIYIPGLPMTFRDWMILHRCYENGVIPLPSSQSVREMYTRERYLLLVDARWNQFGNQK